MPKYRLNAVRRETVIYNSTYEVEAPNPIRATEQVEQDLVAPIELILCDDSVEIEVIGIEKL